MRTYTALRRLYDVCVLSGLCACIRLLRVKRLVHTDTAYRFLQCLGDSVLRIRLFVWRADELILRFIDSSDVCATVVMDRLEDPSEGCDLQGSFADNMYVLIGPSWGSLFWFPSRYSFAVFYVIHRPTITSNHLLLSNTITRCSNITVNYARSVEL